MTPGTKVVINVDTWIKPKGSTGVVHTKNLTEGYISVSYDFDAPGLGDGTVFDFPEEVLTRVEE